MCGGGAIGGGIGSILGDIAGAALAPETFGASLALPIALGAGGGALGNVLGSAIGGQPISPLGVAESAGFGGLGGGVGAGGFSDVAGFLGGAPSTALQEGAQTALGGAGDLATGAGALGTVFDPTGGAGPSFLGGDVGTSTPIGADVSGSTAGTTTGTGVLGGTGATTGGTAGATTSSLTNPFDVSQAGTPAAGTPGSTPDVFGGTGQGGIGGTLETFGQGAPTTTGAAPASDLFGQGPSALGGAAPGDLTSTFTAPLGAGSPLTAAGGGFSFGDVSNWIKQNSPLLSLGLGGGNILRQLMQPGIDTSALNQQQMQAYQRLQQLYSQLTGPGGGGQLTPEQEQQFNNDLAAVQSGIRGKYGSLGMAGSTSQMEDLAAAQAASTAGKANAMSQNLRTGLNAAGMLPQFSTPLLNYQLNQDAQLSDMIARLAAAGLTPQPNA